MLRRRMRLAPFSKEMTPKCSVVMRHQVGNLFSNVSESFFVLYPIRL